MSTARFIENQTGLECTVETVFSWADENARESIVSIPVPQPGYPPRRYHISQDELARHFTIVTPQEIVMHGYGLGDRPTKQQRELSLQANR